MSKHIRALFIGIIFVLPFILMNFIVALRLEPFYSFLGSFELIRNSTLTPLVLLLLFPIGAFVAVRPMLRKNADSNRHIYVANTIFAIITIIIFLVLFAALGEEAYRCDVLQIPNCD